MKIRVTITADNASEGELVNHAVETVKQAMRILRRRNKADRIDYQIEKSYTTIKSVGFYQMR